MALKEDTCDVCCVDVTMSLVGGILVYKQKY
jgi:hypothetical protein